MCVFMCTRCVRNKDNNNKRQIISYRLQMRQVKGNHSPYWHSARLCVVISTSCVDVSYMLRVSLECVCLLQILIAW